ncbi:hypothetical protein WICMUC_005343 [Wickerhamomyces mucosus]|uniref:Cell division control protein 50 n=1 Tax=Wickerhamomyces mucosus TaxID=1378264 RepID=A0A9P8T6I3_9ASCO|nr:hypothetical protein WICMUC_005343 [Wickerhamomyces mucosus]
MLTIPILDTAFRQQRLKSWQPILTPKSVLPLLFLTTIIFTPLGIALLFTTYQVQDLVIDYSQCLQLADTDFADIPSKYVSKHFKSSSSKPQWRLVDSSSITDDSTSFCQIQFEVPNDIKAPLYLFYKLTNFYQNHREYVNSFDYNQLQGVAVKPEDLSSDCSPLKTNSEGKAYYPCGLISNSLFNDTFYTPELSNGTDSQITFTNAEISWSVDRSKYKKTKYDPSKIVPPPNWAKKYPDGYSSTNLPDISTWYEFQVWMRTAGLPEFMKLALKSENGTLAKGTYYINIESNFPVSIFGGTKSIVLTTSNAVGGRNVSLGVAYLIVAGLSITFGIIFLIKYIIQPRKLGDHSYLNFDHHQDDNDSQPPLRQIL